MDFIHQPFTLLCIIGYVFIAVMTYLYMVYEDGVPTADKASLFMGVAWPWTFTVYCLAKVFSAFLWLIIPKQRNKGKTGFIELQNEDTLISVCCYISWGFWLFILFFYLPFVTLS